MPAKKATSHSWAGESLRLKESGCLCYKVALLEEPDYLKPYQAVRRISLQCSHSQDNARADIYRKSTLHCIGMGPKIPNDGREFANEKISVHEATGLACRHEYHADLVGRANTYAYLSYGETGMPDPETLGLV